MDFNSVRHMEDIGLSEKHMDILIGYFKNTPKKAFHYPGIVSRKTGIPISSIERFFFVATIKDNLFDSYSVPFAEGQMREDSAVSGFIEKPHKGFVLESNKDFYPIDPSSISFVSAYKIAENG